MFAVVHFLEEATVESVPKSWTYIENNNEMCKWPSKSHSHYKIGKLIKTCKPPEDDWEAFVCRIMKLSDNYEDSCKLAKRAQNVSDLDMTTDDNRFVEKRKSLSYFSKSDSDEDEDLVIPPTPPRKAKTLKSAFAQNFSSIGKYNKI